MSSIKKAQAAALSELGGIGDNKNLFSPVTLSVVEKVLAQYGAEFAIKVREKLNQAQNVASGKLIPMRPKPHASRTLMISYRSVPVGVAISAAMPEMCAELAAPPTLRLCLTHLHPLVMCIGLPYRSRAA